MSQEMEPATIKDPQELGEEVKSTTLSKCAAIAVVGAAVLGVGVGGLSRWLTAKWWHDPGPYSYAPPRQNVAWSGYKPADFPFLVMFDLCTTIGYAILWVGITTGARVARHGHSALAEAVWIGLQLALGLASLATGVLGVVVWGGQSFMNCLGIFCVNTNTYHEVTVPHTTRDSAGEGWLGILGVAAFFSLAPLGLLLTYRTVRFLTCTAYVPEFPAQPADARAIATAEASRRRLIIFGFIGTEIFFVFLAIVTFYLPDDWEYFTDARIAQSAALQVVGPGKTPHEVNHIISNTAIVAPEFPWAFFVTHQVELIANQLYLKLWPGNVMFYLYLLGLLASAFVVTHTKADWADFWSKPMFKKVHKPFAWWPEMRFTRGEFVGTWITKWMLMVFSVYWIHDHNYNNNWSLSGGPGTTNAERWARAFGQIAVVLLSLLLFAGSRNSLMHKLLGTSWESFLWAHKALGWGMLAALFFHIVLWWKEYSLIGTFPQDIFRVPPIDTESTDNFTVPLIFITSMILFICMGLLTYDGVRRRFFEVFYYSHLFAAYITIPVVLWHAASGWEYMLPGLTVWMVDRLFRASRSAAQVQLLSAKSTSIRDAGSFAKRIEPAACVELKFHVDSGALTQARPGQYVFINVPEISVFEWHPFTLSRTAIREDTALNQGNYLSLHIKSMGDNTWTGRLYELVSRLQTVDGGIPAGSISLAVDGPCGTPFAAEKYTDVVLIGGGIGVTPVSCIFDHFKRAREIIAPVVAEADAPLQEAVARRRLHAVWALREEPLLWTDLRGSMVPLAPEDHRDDTRPVFAECTSTVFLTRHCNHESFLELEANVKGLPRLAQPINFACGRPDVKRLLATYLCDSVAPADGPIVLRPNTKPVVFVCGPEPLVKAAQEWCDLNGVAFHRETFLL